MPRWLRWWATCQVQILLPMNPAGVKLRLSAGLPVPGFLLEAVLPKLHRLDPARPCQQDGVPRHLRVKGAQGGIGRVEIFLII